MPAYIETMDVTTPAGGSDISLGDDVIRTYKRAMAERLNEDHVMPADETGFNTVGYHRKVTLVKQAADPSEVVDAGIFYTKDTGSGKMEAFFIDEAGNITQLTLRGNLARLAKEVIMWFGTIATIPSGLYLCDGTGGRPDLRDKFIIGARQDDSGVAKTFVEGSLAQSGGSVTHIHGVGTYKSDVHNHGGAATPITQFTDHTASPNTGVNIGDQERQQSAVIPNQAATAIIGQSDTITHLPPYYAMAFLSPYNV